MITFLNRQRKMSYKKYLSVSYFLAFMLLFSNNIINIQAQYQFQYSTTISNDGDNRLNNCLVTDDEQLFCVGVSTALPLVENMDSQYDVWLISLNSPNPNPLNDVDSFAVNWQKSFGGFGNEAVKDLIQLPDGNILIAGSIDSLGADVGENWAGATDAFLIKVDLEGNLIWFKTYGTENNEVFEDIVLSNDGESLLAIGTHIQEGSETDLKTNIWILKIGLDGDSEGEIIWEKSYGSDQNDEGISIIQKLGTDNFVISGFVSEASGDVGTNLGGKDVWLAELDPNGNILWEQSYGGTKSEVPTDLIQLQTGDYAGQIVVLSETLSELESYHGNGDWWVLFLDENGEELKSSLLGGSSLDIPKKLMETEYGNVVAIGETFSINGDVQTPYQALNSWFVLIRPLPGDPIYQATVFGGNQFDSALGIVPNGLGGFIVCGYTDSVDGDLAGKQAQHGNHNAWIFTLNNYTLGLPNLDKQMSLQIEQNNRLFDFGTPISEVAIFDAMGRMVFEQDNITQTLMLSTLPNGMYVLRLNYEGQFYSKTIYLGER